MKITKVIGYALSSPYGNGKVLGQPLGVKSIGFVEVHTDTGLIGLGETYAGVYAPELVASIAEFIGSRIAGLDPLHPEEVARKAYVPFISRNGLFCSVYSAVDIALWDIAGQAAGKPIHELLNKNQYFPVKVYASGGSAAMDAEAVASDARAAANGGFSGFKMRVGVQNWETDLKRVSEAKRALGDKALMVDAIMGTINPPWDLAMATERVKALSPFNLAWLEEPLHPDDVLNLKKLKEISSIPIATGEALTGWLDYSAYLEMNAVNIIQVDPTHCGGITVAKKVIERAAALGIPTAMHVWGSTAAYAANAHLAMAFPSVEWLEVPMVSFELSTCMSDRPIVGVDQGIAQKLMAPGLGARIDEKMRSEYQMVIGSGYRL